MEKFRQLFKATGVTFNEWTNGSNRFLTVEGMHFVFSMQGKFLGTEFENFTPRKAS